MTCTQHLRASYSNSKMPVSFEWSSSEDNMQRDPSWPLLVSNLHPLVDKRMLHDVFDPFGPICSLQVFRSRNNLCRGYALVTFEHRSDAKNALEALDFSELLDKRPMRVVWADHLLFPGNSEIADLCEDISFSGPFQACRVHKNNSFEESRSQDNWEVPGVSRPKPVKQSLGRKLVNTAKNALTAVLTRPEAWVGIGLLATAWALGKN